MPFAILLCGPQGSGKSTFVENYAYSFEGWHIASSDRILAEEAKRQNKTYAEIFDSYAPTAQKLYLKEVKQSIKDKKHIIFDRTHVTAKSRKRTLDLLTEDYYTVAIYFPAYRVDELMQRIAMREQNGGHSVPQDIVEWFSDTYTKPTTDEGFGLVYSVEDYMIRFEKFKNGGL